MPMPKQAQIIMKTTLFQNIANTPDKEKEGSGGKFASSPLPRKMAGKRREAI